MKLLIGLFILALLAAASTSIGVEIWDGRFGQQDPTMRVIHYDTKYDLSAQRRVQGDW